MILIYAVPFDFAVMTALFELPFLIVATFVFELLHFRLPAFAYEPLFVLSETVKVFPLPKVILELLSLTLVGAFLTVTLQLAVLPL